MPYTMEDFRRDYTKEHLYLLTDEEILQGLSTEEIKAYLEKRERQQTHATRSKRDPIPSFKSVDEFQDFFDTHDLTDYEDVLKEVELEFSPKETRGIDHRFGHL